MRNRKPLRNAEQKVTPALGATQSPKQNPGGWASGPLQGLQRDGGANGGSGEGSQQILTFTRLGRTNLLLYIGETRIHPHP